jgi:pimeloyl-ACP methyl ester carboxylesterase
VVHGLAASIALSWRATGVLDRLVAQGLHVVAYDTRGHGASDAPHDPNGYGDERLVADLAEVIERFVSARAVVAGYSIGAATALLALADGLDVAGVCLGGTPKAVLGWTAADEDQRALAVAALEGHGPPPDSPMQAWIGFLDATGTDKVALAALPRCHQPVVRAWERITAPAVVGAGINDTTAAPTEQVVARLSEGRAIHLPGDHIGALVDPAFTDAIAELAYERAL